MKSRPTLALLLAGSLCIALSTRSESAGPSTRGWEQPERGLPFFTAFDVPPTRHNGEVWAFASADHGRLWIGSDELFLFDGKNREKIELPFGTYAVRALAHDRDGKLWLGSIGEIGHLEPTATGGWRYVSAREQLRAAGVENLRDIWRAHRTPEGVVFVADQQVLRWNGTRFEHWTLPSSPNLLTTLDRDTLWIFQSGVGLLRMEASGPQLVVPAADLPGAIVFWALQPDEPGVKDGLLICTTEGVFRRLDDRWTKLGPVSAAVQERVPLHAVMLDARTFAVGSYLGGLTIASTDGRVLAALDRTNGLPQETITGLWFDGGDRLWIGYHGGMASFASSGATSVFDGRNGLSETPALKVLGHAGTTHILTRRMLSKVDAGPTGRPAVATHAAHLPGPLSDALSQEGNLWLSGFGGGIWHLTDGRITEATPAPGYIFALSKAVNTPYTLLYLRNTAIEALRPATPAGWKAENLAADVDAYPLDLVRDQAGDLWISTVTRGIFRFRFVPNEAGASSRLQLTGHFQAGRGLPHAIERPRLTTVGGRVFLFSENEILAFDPGSSAFVSAPSLDSFSITAAAPTDDPAQAYWVIRRSQRDDSLAADSPVLVRVRLAASAPVLSPVWEPLSVPDLAHIGRISAISFTAAEGGTLWVAGSQSLLRLAVPLLQPPPPPPALTLRRIERNGTTIELPRRGDTPQFDAGTARLRLELAGATRADGDHAFVQASLGGLSEEWSRLQRETAFDFTGLRPGVYKFRARAVDAFGRTGPAVSLSFSVAAPWYQRAPAIVAYALAGLLLVLMGVRWRLRRLRRQNEQLNQLVEERTRELAHANTTKNEFLENISHEIRNPLNGIANLVDLLRDAPLQPEERRLAQSLGRSTEHLKQVFADVLSYTKLEYGQVNLHLAPFSLTMLLQDIVALHGIEARRLQTELTLALPPGFNDGFLGDAEKIRAIISNYVSNALKYAPGRPVRVEVTCETSLSDPALTEVLIGVRDHGPGLPPEEQALLFRKFARGARAKASGISGTGLGLATCRSMAELMDGRVGVTSQPGEGATFWLRLPLERAAVPPALPAVPLAPSVPAEGARALIVDDQEYNQTVLRGIARRLGYEADVASHAGEVWPLIAQHRYSVVFLDWELPGLNGGEIARRLRREPFTRSAIIIATTAHDTDDIRQHCLESGMDGFALKPFDTAKMRFILGQAHAHHAGRTAAAVENSPATATTEPRGLTLGAFADFAAGDPARARSAVSLYLQTLAQELDALRAAMDRGDREQVARQAHRLRSHAGLVNGTALNTAAQHLVQAARDPSRTESDWRKLCPPVFAEGEALQRAVTSLRTDPTAAG